MKVEQVGEDLRRHRRAEVHQRIRLAPAGRNPKSSQPLCEVLGVLVAASLAPWEQPLLGTRRMSTRADLSTPWKLAEQRRKWLGHEDDVLAEAHMDFVVDLDDVLYTEPGDPGEWLGVEDNERYDYPIAASTVSSWRSRRASPQRDLPSVVIAR